MLGRDERRRDYLSRHGAIRFVYRERGQRLARVQLAHRVPGLPSRLTRRGRVWELVAPRAGCRPARVPARARRPERQLGVDRRPRESAPRVRPLGREVGARASAATGRLPGSTRSRSALPKASVFPEPDPARRPPGAAAGAHPDADESSPLLVAHDGPEYADHCCPPDPARPACRRSAPSSSRRSTGTRPTRPPPCYARALVEELLPAFGPAPHRIGDRREPRRALAPARAPPLSGELRRALPPVGELLPPARSPRVPLPPLRPDRPLHRQRARRTGRAADPGHDRLRHDRGQLPGERRDVRGAAAAGLRRALPAVSRRAQLGGVARQLPPAPRAS